MSLENKKDLENKKERNYENYTEDMYVKNSIDYGSCEPSESGGDGEIEENDLNELALLGFFNDFALIDIGIHEFIREVYFEE